MRNSLLNLDNHTQSPNPDSIGLFSKHFLTTPVNFFNILNTGLKSLYRHQIYLSFFYPRYSLKLLKISLIFLKFKNMRKLKIAIWLNFICALGLKTSHKFLALF